jgi:hypothetical protein
MVRLAKVQSYVALQDFCHQRIHGAATRGERKKYFTTVAFFIEGLFNGINLASDTINPG